MSKSIPERHVDMELIRTHCEKPELIMFTNQIFDKDPSKLTNKAEYSNVKDSHKDINMVSHTSHDMSASHRHDDLSRRYNICIRICITLVS